ncbi:putative leucine-rich repeat domain superfamily [Helianthus anomalus]
MKDLWEKIGERVGSYIINDPKGCFDTLALSYDHLPCHLKKYFLYLGGFPEDFKVQVRTLIRLWIAEGFIKESGQRSLEEEGEDHLMDLIDRNLLIVADKSSNGGIKSCRLHDLLREVCLRKASEENFFKKMFMSMSNNNPFSDSASNMVKQRRLFTDYEVLYKIHSHAAAIYTRSVLCLYDNRRPAYRTTSWVSSFLLLRVLDLLNIPMIDSSKIRMLVHLRYLAVWSRSHDFIFLKAGLWSLQTLIVKGKFQSFVYLPDNMVNLRHLRCREINIPIEFSVPTLLNLQTISRLRLDHRTQFLLESFPNIKKLGCSIASTSNNHGLLSFAMLTHLEALNIDKYMYATVTLANPIKFPETLKKLTLKGLCLPWNYMSTIQHLPKLEVLKLLDSSFGGDLWKTGDEQFQQLKYLKLEKLNIRVWEASCINFPRLRKLVVRSCEFLKEIPLGLGNIYTLEHIEIDYSNSRVLESVTRIQEAQREMGNYDIRVNFTHMDPSEVFFEGNPFYE